MGDFAAGKVLDHIEIQPVETSNFDQFVTDVEAHSEFAKSVAEASGPADQASREFDRLVAGIVAGSSGELLVCLKQWRDVGFSLFLRGDGSFCVHSMEQIVAQEGWASGDGAMAFVIASDLNDDALYMNSSGARGDGLNAGPRLWP